MVEPEVRNVIAVEGGEFGHLLELDLVLVRGMAVVRVCGGKVAVPVRCSADIDGVVVEEEEGGAVATQSDTHSPGLIPCALQSFARGGAGVEEEGGG